MGLSFQLGSRTTGEEALRGADLSGRTAVVTGGSSGLGVETVRVLASAGAKVILGCRNVQSGEEVVDALKADGLKVPLEVLSLDLANLRSVDEFAAALLKEDRIDYLILNAGVMACPLSYTTDGFEMQIGTNHFGHWALTEAVLPKLKKQGFPSRIVAVSGDAYKAGTMDLQDLHFKHGRKYGRVTAYAQSKLANILFVRELAERCKGTQVSAFSLHPGVIKTSLGRSFNKFLSMVFYFLISPFLKSVPQGVATTIFAATAPELDGRSGAYLKNCRESKLTGQAAHPELPRKLWDVTAEQIAEARTKCNLAAKPGT
eukprot:jgi/Botrbrau1/9551/Bobra.0089s0010.1